MAKKFSFSTFILLIASLCFFSVAVFYNVNMQGYQQFGFLANSFLHGKLYFLSEYGSWWHDAVSFGDHYFWPLGPFPAVVLMPFVAVSNLFKVEFLQGYLQIFLIALIFSLISFLSKKIGWRKEDSIGWAFAFCFASNFLGVAFWPNSWFFAQVVTTLLIFLSFTEFMTKKRFWLIGVIYGLLVLTRLPASLGVTFFGLWIIFRENKKLKKLIVLGLPFLVAALIMATYNYARFGDFLEQGYGMQITAGAFDDNLKSKLFALHHIPGNLYYMLLATPQPVFVEGSHILRSPFIKADPWGMSIFLTAPYLILVFGLKYKDIFSKLLLVTVAIISIPIITYYGIGWYQFGFRYALDFLPFLFVALVYEYRKTHEKLPTGLLMIFLVSAIFNLYLFKDLFIV